jgi:hypothetical protein
LTPEKGCGKTTLIDVLACLVWRPLLSANITIAPLFRAVELQQPTLLIDEADIISLAERRAARHFEFGTQAR